MKCALCSRPLNLAAVFIGSYPIGPKCARKAGLMPLAAKRFGEVRPGPMFQRSATRQELDQLDLFKDAA